MLKCVLYGNAVHLTLQSSMYIQVVPGRAGGGSFKRKKNYIAKKEFAYRMCARWPTIAMSKFFSEVWTKLLPLHGCHVMRFGVTCLWFDLLSNDVASCEVICGTTPTYYSSTTLYSVLQSTTPVLLCTTKYYSSTTLYYKVLLQYYSPVLQRTTLYYKVLLQYYSVLQSTTPVLLCTTKYYSVLQSTTRYYSSTTLYYKVLLQYYSVLRQYYNVLLCTTKYYKVLLQYYSVLQSTTPVLLCTTKYYASTTHTAKYYSGTTLYYKVLLRYYSVLRQYYNVLLCTTKYYKVLLQYYSVLQSTTPVLLCTTKYYASTTHTAKYYSGTTLYYQVLLRYYSVLHSTTPVLLCTTQYYNVLLCTAKYYKVLLQYYSVLQSTTLQYYNVLLCTTKYYSSTTLYYKVLLRYYSVLHSTTPVLLCTTQYYNVLLCTAKYYNVLREYYSVLRQYYNLLLRYYFETSFTMRGATRVSVQLHQILRLPRKMNVINDLRHIWNVISNAWSKSSHPPTSPNTAPATQNECHQWSASHMKPHFQCVEQVKSPSNLTKYCACHAKWMSSMICVTYETSFPMRGASKATLQPHQILRLPRKMNVINDLRHIWNVISNARSN